MTENHVIDNFYGLSTMNSPTFCFHHIKVKKGENLSKKKVKKRENGEVGKEDYLNIYFSFAVSMKKISI